MRTIYIIVCALLVCTLASAQSNNNTIALENVDDAWVVALKNNPNKQVYDLNIQKAKIDYKTAQSFLYPSVSAGLNGQDNLSIAVTPIPGEIFNQPGKTIYAKFGKHYVYNGGVTLSRSLFNWQAMAQAKAAENNIALNQAQAEAYAQGLKQQTAQYYYTALIAKAAVILSDSDLAVAEHVASAIKQRLDEGLTDASAVNTALINQNQVFENKLQSEQLLQESLQNLRILLGLQKNDILVLKQQVDVYAFENMVSPALGGDKNLLVYPHQVRNAELNEKVERNAYTPQIALSTYFGKQQFRDDFGVSFANGAWSDYQYIGLNVNVPIFTGFATKYKIKSAEVSKSVAMQQYKAAQEQSLANDSITLLRATSYGAISKASADNFKLYGVNCTLTKQKFDEGMVSIDVYLKSFQDYLTAENTHLNNLTSLYSNYAVILSRQ